MGSRTREKAQPTRLSLKTHLRSFLVDMFREIEQSLVHSLSFRDEVHIRDAYADSHKSKT